MTVELPSDLASVLHGIQIALTEISSRLDLLSTAAPEARSQEAPRDWYSVAEVATMLGRSEYTVRELCRLGRLNASKREERRGGSALWSISAKEIERYRNEGLLPLDPGRNG
jgi:hypothetical protein